MATACCRTSSIQTTNTEHGILMTKKRLHICHLIKIPDFHRFIITCREQLMLFLLERESGNEPTVTFKRVKPLQCKRVPDVNHLIVTRTREEHEICGECQGEDLSHVSFLF